MDPAAALSHLRERGLTYPGAHLKTPWPEHLDLAVKDKTFAFMSAPGASPSLSLKLPYTREAALELSYAEPTGYGLGTHGWISFKLEGAELDIGQFEQWLDESYRAVAPKSLVKLIGG